MGRFVRSNSVVSRVIAGETLVVPVRGGVGDLASIYSLNSVATAIWDAIAQPRSKTEIVELILQEYEVPVDSVASDVESFLMEMTSAGLIQTAQEEATA